MTVATSSSMPNEEELVDPHDPDLIVSYDVMGQEVGFAVFVSEHFIKNEAPTFHVFGQMEKIEAALKTLPAGTMAAEELSDRHDSFALKRQVCATTVAMGEAEKLNVCSWVVLLCAW